MSKVLELSPTVELPFPTKEEWQEIGFCKPSGHFSNLWEHYNILKNKQFENKAICIQFNSVISRGLLGNKNSCGAKKRLLGL